MKKLLAIFTLSLASFAAFAQGTVLFANDSLHLVCWGPGAGALAGIAVGGDSMPGGLTGVSADLYMGTSSSALFLYASSLFTTNAGRWTPINVQANGNGGLPGIPGGTSVFVEVAVHSTEKPPSVIFDPAILQTFQAYGASVMFTFILGTFPPFPPLYGPNGTWPIGTFPMDQLGTGARGAIQVNIPEPSTVALAALAAVGMLLRRYRK